MMLCEDTMGSYVPVVTGIRDSKPSLIRAHHPEPRVVSVQRPGAPDSLEIPEALLNAKIPKNKNAKRRLVASIHENIDRYKRGSDFKKKGRPLPSGLAMSIRKIR